MNENGRVGIACSHRHNQPERTHHRDAPSRLAGQSPREKTKVEGPATYAWTAKTRMSKGSPGVERFPSRAGAKLL